jgi:DnaK suppressor protein
MTQRPGTLDHAQLETARHALSRKREELLHAIGGLREPPLTGEPGDRADLATAEIAVDERTELAAQERALLTEVEHALAKLDAGTYGISESTGAPIRWERLQALPWARTDIHEPLP